MGRRWLSASTISCLIRCRPCSSRRSGSTLADPIVLAPALVYRIAARPIGRLVFWLLPAWEGAVMHAEVLSPAAAARGPHCAVAHLLRVFHHLLDSWGPGRSAPGQHRQPRGDRGISA